MRACVPIMSWLSVPRSHNELDLCRVYVRGTFDGIQSAICACLLRSLLAQGVMSKACQGLFGPVHFAAMFLYTSY